MTILNGHTNAVPHRANRRRERPGSRARRTVTRKYNIRDECDQGILDARDMNIPLPSDKAKPSPLLRQNFDQSWQRWQERKAAAVAQVENEKQQLEKERMLLFGGEVDDDDLFRMGILYFDEEEPQDCESRARGNSVLCDVPLHQDNPMFVMRPGRSRRQRSTWRSLPLYLSFSDLSSDTDIARLISSIPSTTPTIQHRDPISSTTASIIDIENPQSLPAHTPASSHQSTPSLILPGDINSPSFISAGEDWTLITHAQTQHGSTPSSEPETWILCDDLQQISTH